MKWFKHMANARNDEFLESLIEEFGIEAYGRWWITLEIIAEAMDKNPQDPSATHLLGRWREKLFFRYQKNLIEFMEFCQKWGKFQLTFIPPSPMAPGVLAESSKAGSQREVEGSQAGALKVTCPNILKMRDEYTRKKNKTPDNVAQETETEKETEKKVSKKAQAPVAAIDRNQMKGTLSALPPWIPKEAWAGYKEMRGKLRKPMTALAEDLVIKRLKEFRDAGLDIVAILNQSIEHSWAGVYKIKPEVQSKFAQPEMLPHHKRMENYKT